MSVGGQRTKEILAYASDLGFEVVRRTGSGHIMLGHPNGARVTVSGSLGYGRADLNARAQLRRAAAGVS